MKHHIIGPFNEPHEFIRVKRRLIGPCHFSTIAPGKSLRYSEMYEEWIPTNEFTPDITPEDFINKYPGRGQGTWEN